VALSIRQVLLYPGGIGLVLASTKTSGSERRIALPGPMHRRPDRSSQPARARTRGHPSGLAGDGLVFTTRHGRLINSANVNRDFKALLESGRAYARSGFTT
jgi:hypothetical protein